MVTTATVNFAKFPTEEFGKKIPSHVRIVLFKNIRLLPNQVEAESGDHFIEVSITDHQKVGDGMGAYVLYKVSTRTNMPLFKKRELAVMRRFSDFLGLHDKLTEKYLKSGRIIPPAPEKSVIGEWARNEKPFDACEIFGVANCPVVQLIKCE